MSRPAPPNSATVSRLSTSDEIAGIVFKRALAIAVMAAPRVLNRGVDIGSPCLGDFAAHDEWLLFRFKTVSRVAPCLSARSLALRRKRTSQRPDRGERHPLNKLGYLRVSKNFVIQTGPKKDQ
jgi:hypothetical protein